MVHHLLVHLYLFLRDPLDRPSVLHQRMAARRMATEEAVWVAQPRWPVGQGREVYQ